MNNFWKEFFIMIAYTIPAWSIAAWMFYAWDIGGIRSDIEKARKERFEKKQRERLDRIRKEVEGKIKEFKK